MTIRFVSMSPVRRGSLSATNLSSKLAEPVSSLQSTFQPIPQPNVTTSPSSQPNVTALITLNKPTHCPARLQPLITQQARPTSQHTPAYPTRNLNHPVTSSSQYYVTEPLDSSKSHSPHQIEIFALCPNDSQPEDPSTFPNPSLDITPSS